MKEADDREVFMKSTERKRTIRWAGIILLCVMISVCLYACTGRNPENTGSRADRVEQILSDMTLQEKVEQMMVVSFREWKESHPAIDDNASRGFRDYLLCRSER